ncbi:hypothetical protein F383_34684 [Gossypium arboreum]|uniref:Uncharacterized protein n=1 Tax=Gossypium arboreum TaxID=29729 RepID=A0A0B0N3Q3_GOSAR|nr:hypothetical protein F383_34684 [Gossypium arboreum]
MYKFINFHLLVKLITST